MKKFPILAVALIATQAIIFQAKADIYDAIVYCQVEGIRTGQLALRNEPNGKPFAGLNNGNQVQATAGTLSPDRNGSNSTWEYVKVLQGPNRQVNGRQGWVNSDYLSCNWYDENGTFIRHEPAKKR
ncbi:SH3 domain-containing protein [Tolypothrix bouteillei VB521301_2]|uniref:SH3 domain-containing protein n=1 Tax=Tolypothrix bouteillei TaxID=1246981 RepID=UPI000513BB8D